MNTSQKLFERSKKCIPGGVNSPVRAFKSVGGTPIFMDSAKSAYMHDVDGRSYIDYINSWGPMILGHAHPQVVEAIQKQAEKSSSFGAPTELEAQMAEQVCSMVPGLEQVRMVNSGTEACMSAIRLARGYTGRDKIIKFAGCYHGHFDSFLVKAGSGMLTFGTSNSQGVTAKTASDTLIAEFNDIESVEALFDANPEEIACIIVEPVAGNMGCIPPKDDFLKKLKNLCEKHKSLLVLDEVMTGFRLAKGGAQEVYDVRGDIMCFGKIIGGGLPVGAFGGRKDIFDFLAPNGPVYQAGTLSGNPLAMAAGLTTLKILDNDPSIYMKIAQQTEKLEKEVSAILSTKGIAHSSNRIGSMVSFFYLDHEVMGYNDAQHTDTVQFNRIFWKLIENGVYLPPSNYESWFVSEAHDDEVIQRTLEGWEKV